VEFSPLETQPQRRLGETVRQIQVLLQRHQLVEQLVQRQEQPRHHLVEDLVHRQHLAELQNRLLRLHSADLALVIESFPPAQRQLLWQQICDRRGGETLISMSDPLREAMIKAMSPAQLTTVLRQSRADDITDIATDLPTEALQQRLLELTADDRQWFQYASSYPEGTVGGLMTNDLAVAYVDETQQQTLTRLRAIGTLPNHTDKLFVTDRRGHFLGVLSLQQLLLADPEAVTGQLMSSKVVSFRPDDSAKEAATAFDRYQLVSAPVLSERASLLGRLRVDVMIDYLRERSADQVLNIAGLSAGEELFASIWDSARNRWTWLSINLVTAMAAALVIGAFEETITKIVALAALMPIVASLGGNTGNQTGAILIRRLGQGELTAPAMRQLARKELGVSLVNGLLFGAVVGLFTLLLFAQPGLALVISLAVFLVLVLAASLVLLVPATLEPFGRDPALGSSILVTATVDVLGFLLFPGLAAMWLV